MVLITFSGIVDNEFLKIHSDIFPKSPPGNKRNPNNCPMVSTIFVRGERTDYCVVNRLWAYNHEIGLNGKTQKTEQFWLDADESAMVKETFSLREDLNKKSKIPIDEITGSRTPFYVGNKHYYSSLEEFKFEYDSSIIVGSLTEEHDKMPSTFPYTMGNVIGTKDDDPSSEFKCSGGRPDLCPKDEYEYLWQVPVQFSYLEGGGKCKDLAVCTNATEIGEAGIQQFLKTNFERHKSKGIPYMINFNIQHMKTQSENYVEGLNLFLEDLSKEENTWVITLHQALEWMKNPTDLSNVNKFPAWGCQLHVLDGCKIIGEDGEDDEENKNKTKVEKEKKSIQSLFPDGQKLVIGQTVFLIVLFVVIQQYDHWKNNKNK